ncbi:hypothetical protein V8F33_011378 [Rhypophila sp. PSN 637]
MRTSGRDAAVKDALVAIGGSNARIRRAQVIATLEAVWVKLCEAWVAAPIRRGRAAVACGGETVAAWIVRAREDANVALGFPERTHLLLSSFAHAVDRFIAPVQDEWDQDRDWMLSICKAPLAEYLEQEQLPEVTDDDDDDDDVVEDEDACLFEQADDHREEEDSAEDADVSSDSEEESSGNDTDREIENFS